MRAAPAQVYAFFSDPRQLLDCLDHPHTVDTAQGDQFAGTITTGVAFIRGTFRFDGGYTARTPGQHVTTRIGLGLGSAVDYARGRPHRFLVGDRGGLEGRHRADLYLATLGERLVRSTIEKKAAGLFEKARQKPGVVVP